MIPWVHNIMDLRSIGVPVTPAQERVLEEGGQVLAIARLPSYEMCDCGDDHGTAVMDSSGQPMMVPYVFKASPPLSTYGMPWKGETETIASVLEGQDPDWRLFPSYVGDDHTTVVEPYWESGECKVVRVWTGIPLVDEHDQALATLLINGFRSNVYDSAYDEMREMYYIERAFQDGVVEWDIDDQDDQEALNYRTLRASLVERGYIIEDDESGQWLDGRPLQLDPIEHHVLDPEARALWRALVRQSRSGAYKVLDATLPDRRSQFLYSERFTEPWY